MLNRRKFFKTTGALALGSLLLPACSGNTPDQTAATDENEHNNAAQGLKNLAVGLQLYTLRDQMDQDVRGTLEKVAAIGYKDLESAAGRTGHYYGMKPKEFATMAEDMGMKLRSSHVLPGMQLPEEAPLPPEFLTLNNGLQQLVDMAAASGQSYLTCAFMFPSERKTLDQYKRAIELFNRAGEACNKAGLTFAYYNHDFEFETLEGQRPYDLILQQTDKALVGMELDLYWISKAGLDPLTYFEKYPKRFPLWHVKDMDKNDQKLNT